MYGYVYLTENLVNGMCYIGQHASESFDTNYKGSGTLLIKAIKKYGSENFICTLIKWCSSKEELDKEEISTIKKCDAVNSKYFYNLSSGGEGLKKGSKHTKEWKINMSNTVKDQYKQGRVSYFATIEPWNKNGHLKDETKLKLSKIVKDKIASGEFKPKGPTGRHWKLVNGRREWFD